MLSSLLSYVDKASDATSVVLMEIRRKSKGAMEVILGVMERIEMMEVMELAVTNTLVKAGGLALVMTARRRRHLVEEGFIDGLERWI